MNKIVIIIFALLLLPYVGLPSTYDIWIVLVLIAALAFFLFQIIKERRQSQTKTSEPKEQPKKQVKKVATKVPEKKQPVLSQDDKESIKQAVRDSQ